MTIQSLDVLIIGAGPGGLCLAQGLAAHGVRARVFERDNSPNERADGYRLGINATGRRALRECLPAALYDELVARSAKASEGVTFLDQRLRRLLGVEFPASQAGTSECDHPVGRNVLRQVLLTGLGERVQFGKKLVAFEDEPNGNVRARFEDGTAASGTLLVGADGAGSRVRQLLLPGAQRVATGIEIISGTFALSDAARARTPAPLWRGPTLVLGPKGRFLFAHALEYPRGDGRAAAPGVREEHVTWGFSTWSDAFSTRAAASNPRELKTRVLDSMAGWHPKLQYLIESTDPEGLRAFPAMTSLPVAPWPTRNVTLLGDALHDMTPFRGVGANAALHDAALLTHTLLEVQHGVAPLLPALARYERQMIDHGFRAVRASLEELERLHGRSLLQRLATKTLFRTADRIPPLKAMLHAGH